MAQLERQEARFHPHTSRQCQSQLEHEREQRIAQKESTEKARQLYKQESLETLVKPAPQTFAPKSASSSKAPHAPRRTIPMCIVGEWKVVKARFVARRNDRFEAEKAKDMAYKERLAFLDHHGARGIAVAGDHTVMLREAVELKLHR